MHSQYGRLGALIVEFVTRRLHRRGTTVVPAAA